MTNPHLSASKSRMDAPIGNDAYILDFLAKFFDDYYDTIVPLKPRGNFNLTTADGPSLRTVYSRSSYISCV